MSRHPVRRPGRRRVLVVLAVLSVVLCACTGVPSGSVPQVVQSFDGSSAGVGTQNSGPAAGTDPRSLVSGFLAANVSTDEKHPAARLYLTANQAAKWNDNTATVVSNDVSISVIDPSTHVVTVFAKSIGTLDLNGVYVPTRTVARERQFAFTMTQIDGEWRIAELPAGLIIRQTDFINSYRSRPLYFFNQEETRLVPDLRYSAALGQTLATWLLTQLINGPLPLTQQTQSPLKNEFPDQITATNAKVTVTGTGSDTPITVQLAGIGVADQPTLSRVAAELAYTFDPSLPGQRAITIYDGTRQLSVANTTTFTKSLFALVAPVPTGAPDLYYVREGGVVDQNGKLLPGELGGGRYHLNSVAVSTAASLGATSAGGTGFAGTDGTASVLVGSGSRLDPIVVPQVPTSRPEWSRDSHPDVWFGDGQRLMRIYQGAAVAVTMSGRDETGRPLSGFTVLAVRFSPEGARVAVVLRGSTTSVWVGEIQGTGRSVQVLGLQRITEDDWVASDVGWSDEFTLDVLTDPGEGDGQIWSIQADGSAIVPVSTETLTDTLPGAAQSITAAPNTLPWVAVGSGTGSTIWQQGPTRTYWAIPFGRTFVPGSAPIYASS